jgi:hypothetical protein
MLCILRGDWSLYGDAQREDGRADLGRVSASVGSSRAETHLSSSPVSHGLQWQICPVDCRCLPPYRQSEEKHDGPKGEDGTSPEPYRFARLWRKLRGRFDRVWGCRNRVRGRLSRTGPRRRVGVVWWCHSADGVVSDSCQLWRSRQKAVHAMQQARHHPIIFRPSRSVVYRLNSVVPLHWVRFNRHILGGIPCYTVSIYWLQIVVSRIVY